MYLKQETHRSPAWLRAVASLPCQHCGKEGETQAAHRNMNKGMGMKTDDAMTAALCVSCHREIDQGKDMKREDRRELLDSAILKTIIQLARRGLIKATS